MIDIIYQLKNKSIGTGITVKYLEHTYPDLFKAVEAKDANKLADGNDKLWRLQNPYFYRCSCINRINDYIMCRKEYASFFPGKKLVDGYSYYRNCITKYQSWFPTVYQSHFECNDAPSIGFYVRDMRTESTMKFVDFTKQLHSNISIVTMGDKECIEPFLANDARWTHIYDNKTFWKSCSHYFYYRCSDFEDPFPQSLLEAIQSKHRIVSPIDPKRNFIDGIDDFLSCIDYDVTFIPENHGKMCEALSSSIWSKHIHSLVDSHFKRVFPLNSGLLYDWICKELR